MTEQEKVRIVVLNTIMTEWRATIDALNSTQDRTEAALQAAAKWDAAAQMLVTKAKEPNV